MLRIERLSFLDWEEISLEVSAGETVCLLGASGSGKSLFLRAVADLIPSRGEISLKGKACSEFTPTEWRRRVGFLSAEVLWWEDRVIEHFLDRPAQSSLDALGLPQDCLDWEVGRLSMGERQRLGLLRILDREPDALLLDEPTSNLDESSASSVESLIFQYIERKGACSLWVTHDADQAKRISRRAYRMEDKRLQEFMNE